MPRSGSRVRVSFAALLTTMSRTNVLLSFSKESPWSRLSYTNARVFVSHSRKNVQAFFQTGSPTQTNEVFVVGRRSNCGDPFVASQQTASQASCDAAQVAELVDAYVSGAYVARRAGSSPVLGTEFFDYSLLGKQATARLLTRKMTCKGRFSKKAEARAGQCCMATFCCERLTPLRRW